MEIKHILSILEWETITESENYTRISSPFTLADDGELLAFSITKPTPDTFILSDNHQAAMHAASFGIILEKSKLAALNKTVGVYSAAFSDSGEITASGSIDTLPFAVLDAVKLAMALSFNYSRWLPKYNVMRFRAAVAKALKESISESSISTDYPVTGASGHIIKFPFAVKRKDGGKVLIETIATDDRKINWDSVYKTHGRLSDVKRIDEANKRLVIMESSEEEENFNRAASFLADTATVRRLDRNSNWSEILKAA